VIKGKGLIFFCYLEDNDYDEDNYDDTTCHKEDGIKKVSKS